MGSGVLSAPSPLFWGKCDSLFYYYDDRLAVPIHLTPSTGTTRGGFTVEVHLGTR